MGGEAYFNGGLSRNRADAFVHATRVSHRHTVPRAAVRGAR
jgi:hypothetical protein